MDDLTVMDGACDEIIKQGKLSKRKPQNVFSIRVDYGTSVLTFCFAILP